MLNIWETYRHLGRVKMHRIFLFQIVFILQTNNVNDTRAKTANLVNNGHPN